MCDCLSSGVQLQNSLKSDLCLDQGPETENVPIVYICHGMTPQVSSEIPVPGVCMCVSGGKREAQLCRGYSGPMDLGGFSLESILMRKKESYLYVWKESKGAEAGMPGSPGVGTRKVIRL